MMQTKEEEIMNDDTLDRLARLVRYYILVSTTRAGSGHPTSSLSATELMTALLFGGFFRYDADDPGHPNNDRLVFSKGHASPLFYALWAAAGKIAEDELMTYRSFGSRLEGHPTPKLPYVEAATGSLGQGLSIGVGIALNAKYLDKLPYRTYVLLGDSEMAEGSQYEAIQIAAHYKLDNLIGILDVNRLGQRGETMYGHDLEAYRQRIAGFGWETIMVADGHSFEQVLQAYRKSQNVSRPAMIIARTIKGKGVEAVEDKDGWHGKTLDKEQLEQALRKLGPVDKTVRGTRIAMPENARPKVVEVEPAGPIRYARAQEVATRDAYGTALVRVAKRFPGLVALDGEVSNSTRADKLEDAHPGRFFEMYIAEQNMAGVALGLSSRGKIPFMSSFAAFLTRATDQIRMAQYSSANIKVVGSHAGVSIGQDGPSQMGLEDIAIFRTIRDAVVVYPCDAVSTEKLVEACAEHKGICYLRTTRGKTPVIYGPEEAFVLGGCKVVRKSDRDRVTVVAAGITVHEALAASEQLERERIPIRVIDLYSIKPIDEETLSRAAQETQAIITVEDHYPEGGLGEAVRSALASTGAKIVSLAVRELPRSGKPEELLRFESISRDAIVKAVREAA